VSFFNANDPRALCASSISTRGRNAQNGCRRHGVRRHFDKLTRLSKPSWTKSARRVWSVGPGPHDGLFALFTMQPNKWATEKDRERFAQVIGRPMLALEKPGGTIHYAGAILDILSHTVEGRRSANRLTRRGWRPD